MAFLREASAGMPTELMEALIANYLPRDQEIFLHSTNGVPGMGPAPALGEEDPVTRANARNQRRLSNAAVSPPARGQRSTGFWHCAFALGNIMPAMNPPSWTSGERPVLIAGGGIGGRVTLGDAAHPMLQYLAQGPNMAIEDAVVLARPGRARRGRLRGGVPGVSASALSTRRARATDRAL